MSETPAYDWQALMFMAQQGDVRAYEQLLHELTPALRRFLQAKLSNHQDAEDVVQDTLLAVHHARHTYRPGDPLAPWVWSIAHHKWVDFLRKSGRVHRLNHSQEVEDFYRALCRPNDETKGSDSLGHEFTAALRVLKPQQRQAIELMKVKGLSSKEAASAMGVSLANVKILAHRGYSHLRSMLQRSDK